MDYFIDRWPTSHSHKSSRSTCYRWLLYESMDGNGYPIPANPMGTRIK